MALAVAHDQDDSALVFAVAEAVRSAADLRLVHVVPELPVGTDPGWTGWTVEAELIEAGRELMAATAERATSLAEGRLAVTTEIVRGRVVPAVVRAALDARLIVLGHRKLSTAMRLVTRSVSSGVAARARVPVAAVPADWAPSPAERPGHVVVGFKTPESSGVLLRHAAHEARLRGGALTVLHTWTLEQPYGTGGPPRRRTND